MTQTERERIADALDPRNTLKPCPFPHVGTELLHGSWPAKHQFWVHCPCGAMGPHAHSPEKAITAWNTRTDRHAEGVAAGLEMAAKEVHRLGNRIINANRAPKP